MNVYTVIGVYVGGDLDNYGERFADHVEAESWEEAEAQVAQKRGGRLLHEDSDIKIVGRSTLLRRVTVLVLILHRCHSAMQT